VDRRFRLLPGLVVSLAFTVWFVWRADWAGVFAALRELHLGWVGVVALFLYLEHVLRAVRFRTLLRDLDPEVRTTRLWVATAIGMSMNVVLPFRIGDLVRPWLVARERALPFVSLLTVAVIERVFDIFGLMGQVLLLGLLAPSDADGVILSRLRWACGFGLAGFTAFGFFVWAAANESRSRRAYDRLVGLLPGPAQERFRSLYDGFSAGLRSVRSGRSLVYAGLLSLLHWTNGSLALWLLCFAFPLDLPFTGALFANVALAVSVGLPQAPGYLGVFHTAIETALRTWSVDPTPAQAYAVVFWFVSFVPITLTGALLFVREGLTSPELRGEMARLRRD